MHNLLPDMPAFTTRHMQMTHKDGVIVAHLVDAEAASACQSSVTDPDECVEQFGRIANFQPDRDTLIVEHQDAGGMVTPAAYAVVRTFKETDGPRVLRHMVKVKPAYLHQGVGTAVLEWCRGRLTEIAEEVATQDPEGTEIVYRTTVSNDAPASAPLLLSHGYTPVVFWATMERSTRDIPDAALPDGVELRPATEDQLRSIWEADVDAFRDHWGFVEPVESDFEEFLAFRHTDHSLWTVAWHGNGIVGQIRSFIDQDENAAFGRKRGWTEFISTARAWRGQGIAGALICESLRRLDDRGMTTARLDVHTANPNGAFELYEKYGYKEVNRATEFEQPYAG